jgi:DUF2934 family protein
MLPEQISKTDPAYVRRVAELAYRYWEQRGRPCGTSEQDWYRAERELETEGGVYGLPRFDR